MATSRAPTKLVVYTLEVWLLDSPTSKHTGSSRTIQMLAGQTLGQMHDTIFRAFNRRDPHMYEFDFGKAPGGNVAMRFRPFAPGDHTFSQGFPLGDAERTQIGSLGLKPGTAFGYLFDFGDRWQHQVDVKAVDEVVPTGRWPRVLKREGKSPAQYEKESDS